MKRHFLILVVALLLAFFAVGPLGYFLVHTLAHSNVRVLHALLSPEFRAALWNTLSTSTLASVISFSLGFPTALLVERTDVWGRSFLRNTFTAPAAIPPFIWAMGWVALANPKSGLLNHLLGHSWLNIYGTMGIAWVLGTSFAPLVFLATSASVRRIDSGLEEAALMSGAGPLTALWHVSGRLSVRSAISAALLAFMANSAAFGVPYLLGVTASPPVHTLSTQIFLATLAGPSGLQTASWLSVELVLLVAAVMFLHRLFRKAAHQVVSLGKGGRKTPMALSKILRLILSLGLLAVVGVSIVMPMLAVFYTSIEPPLGSLKWVTWAHWNKMLFSPRTLDALFNSLLFSSLAATVVVLFGAILAQASLKNRFPRVVAWVGNWPYAIPGSVLALAWLVTFSKDYRLVLFGKWALVLSLSNSMGLILIAYAIKHLSIGTRQAHDAWGQVDGSLVEASRLFGATPLRSFFDAVWPQVKPALFAAFLVTFLTCLTELTLSVLLVPTGKDLLGTLLFELQSYADPNAASVIACSLVACVWICLGALQLNAKQRENIYGRS